MPEYIIKLAGALPKGDVNGWADEQLAEDLWHRKVEGRAIQPRVAVIIYGVREAKVDKNGDCVTTAEVLRVQPVAGNEHRRQLEQMLLAEYRSQTGAVMAPFDVESITKQAFVDLPKTNEEIDQLEAEELDLMSPTDELRRHLERVHGVEGASVMTAEESDSKHQAEHDGAMEEVLGHAHDDIFWTRADLEERIALAGDVEEDESSDPDERNGETGVILTPLPEEDPDHEAGLFSHRDR